MYQRDVVGAGISQMHRMFSSADVCHVLRDHGKHEKLRGPRLFVRVACLEMPIRSTASRAPSSSRTNSASACATSPNVAAKSAPKKFTSPKRHHSVKERVVDEYYDPVMMLVRKIRGASSSA